MQSDNALEYMCPYCGTVNEFPLERLCDMYHPQRESCGNCNRELSLTAAEGIGGRVNLIIDASESDKIIK